MQRRLAAGGPGAGLCSPAAPGHRGAPIRANGRGMMVTQDHALTRLDISHDIRRIITRIDCG
ncbi:MAG: hypothetical protein ACK4S2_03290 [Gemmobacter sp.]|uniref:hypothetical protein n=1 Tax=Gemmobacter sp. TaxID=1898957 RepID=UPI00391CB7EB